MLRSWLSILNSEVAMTGLEKQSMFLLTYYLFIRKLHEKMAHKKKKKEHETKFNLNAYIM